MPRFELDFTFLSAFFSIMNVDKPKVLETVSLANSFRLVLRHFDELTGPTLTVSSLTTGARLLFSAIAENRVSSHLADALAANRHGPRRGEENGGPRSARRL